MTDQDDEIPDNLPAIERELEKDATDMAVTGGDSAYWKNPRQQERNLALHETQDRLQGGEDGQEEAPAVVVEDQDIEAALDNLTAMGTIGGSSPRNSAGARSSASPVSDTLTRLSNIAATVWSARQSRSWTARNLVSGPS